MHDDLQESLTLDYKRSDSLSKSDDKKKLEITKDVSAFANSAGGQIIYGMMEKDQHPTGLDDGSDPKLITREWLEQVINSGIQPRIHGIRIKPISLSNGNVAYVVDIPKADAGGPHQAADQKYYRRFNFQSVPMYHHEIMDVANRAIAPRLEVIWSFQRVGRTDDGNQFAFFDLVLESQGPQPVLYSQCSLFLDEDGAHGQLVNQLAAGWSEDRNVPQSTPYGDHEFRSLQRRFSVPQDHPLYPDCPQFIGRFPMKVRQNTDFIIGWRAVCPGFSRWQWGAYDITVDGRCRLHWHRDESA